MTMRGLLYRSCFLGASIWLFTSASEAGCVRHMYTNQPRCGQWVVTYLVSEGKVRLYPDRVSGKCTAPPRCTPGEIGPGQRGECLLPGGCSAAVEFVSFLAGGTITFRDPRGKLNPPGQQSEWSFSGPCGTISHGGDTGNVYMNQPTYGDSTMQCTW
jgi:hypothetical protein